MKKVTIIAIVAVVVILIAAVACMGGESDPDKDKVQYDYAVGIADSFTTKAGFTEAADEGMTYVIVHTYAKNIGFEDGFKTNSLLMWQWKTTVDSVTYSSSIDGYAHPDYVSPVTLEVGGEFRSVEVFEVPSGTTVDDVQISMKYVDFGDEPVFEKVDVL